MRSLTHVALPPRHSDWWLITLDLLPYVDQVHICRSDWEYRTGQKSSDTYHRLVAERLTALHDSGYVVVDDYNVDIEEADSIASTLLTKIISDPKLVNNLVQDLSFAYTYWINYNKFKLSILDPSADRTYMDRLLTHFPEWIRHYEEIEKHGVKSLETCPEIIEITAVEVLRRISRLFLLERTVASKNILPLETMFEYAPFQKYLSLLNDVDPKPQEFGPVFLSSHPNESFQITNFQSMRWVTFPFPANDKKPKIRSMSPLQMIKTVREMASLFVVLRSKYDDMVTTLNAASDNLGSGKLSESDITSVSKYILECRKLCLDIQERCGLLSHIRDIISYSSIILPESIVKILDSAIAFAEKKETDLSVLIESINLYKKGFRPNGLAAYLGFLDSVPLDNPRHLKGGFWI